MRVVARIDNEVGVNDGERGAPMTTATGHRDTWAALWAQIRRLA